MILRGQGAGEGKFCLLIFLQLTLFCLPALLIGIVTGELLARFGLTFFIRLEIPLVSPFHGIYITVLSLLLVMLLTSLFAGRFYFLGKRKQRKDRALHLATGDVVPKSRTHLTSSGKIPVSLNLGFLSFLRRRRPFASLLALTLTAVFLIAYSGFMDYGTILVEDLQKYHYDVGVSVSGENRAAFEQIQEMVGNSPHSSQRIYRVSSSRGGTLLVNYSLQVRVLSDEDFEKMASSLFLFPATGEISAILQNFGYGEHNKPYYIVEDTSAPIRGNLSDGIEIEIIGFLNEVPLDYETKDTSSGATLFVMESEFLYYGDMDFYRIWFSGKTKEETARLKEEISKVEGATVRFLNEDLGEEMKVPIHFIISASLLFLPLMIFTLILFFARDYISRREEFGALCDLGMERKTLFCYLLTDMLLLIAAIFLVMFSLSAVILKILHFITVGYYAPFYIPWLPMVLLAAGLIFSAFFYGFFGGITPMPC